jgi:hypothetical protein
MYEYKDPSGITRAAVIAVWLYLVADVLFGLSSLASLVSPDPDYASDMELMLAGVTGLGLFVAMIACVILVGRWTYRVNANAHALSKDLTITPGWAVGWHFVPIANLFKPFQAMKEAWLASHYRGAWHGEPASALLGWWWGLWIVTNILSNVSLRMQMQSPELISDAVFTIDFIAAVLNVPLCLVLIRMMKQLSAAQLTAHHDETFA